MIITGYNGTFIKKNGDERTMFFAKPSELSDDTLEDIFGDDRPDLEPPRSLSKGLELVFDIQQHDWRIFNTKTQVGELEPYEVDMPLFYGDETP